MSPPTTLRPGQPLGDFVLESKLALGGMAEIWTARGAEGAVALKVLLPHFVDNPAFLAMFEDEVRIATRLQHRNIIAVRGSHAAEGHVFQSMELLSGFDLRRVLSHAARTGQRFPVPLCLFVAREVARALSYAHTRKNEEGRALDIVHRDVSPHNVMICANGQVKLLDFGIARAAERAAHTRTGVIKGKLAYMAPEQALAVGVTPQTDIFAAGVVLWEMLTIERLFVANSDAELVERVVAAEVPPVQSKNPTVPDDVARLLDRMLAQRAPDRPSSMDEVERSLTRALTLHFTPEASDEAALAKWLARHGPAAAPPTQAVARAPTPEPEGASQEDSTQPDAEPAPAQEVTATMARPSEADDATWAGPLPDAGPTDSDARPESPNDLTALVAPPALVAPDAPQDMERAASDVARTLVDQPMDPSLLSDPPAFLSAPTHSGPPKLSKVRRPTRTEIIRAIENQPTIEVEADPEVAKLAAQIVRVGALPTVEPIAPASADPASTSRRLVAPVVPSAQDTPPMEQPTQLGDLVTPLPPVSVRGTDRSGGYEPLGLRPGASVSPVAAPPGPAAPAPRSGGLGGILPVITLVLAGIVLVLIFLLIRGQ